MDIVEDDGDRRLFVNTLSETSERAGWQILAWGLMFTIILSFQTLVSNVSQQIRRFQELPVQKRPKEIRR